MFTIEQKEQERIQTAITLFNYVIESIKPDEITLEYEKTTDLMKKLLMLQMDVPSYMRAKVENLTDVKIMAAVASTRDVCYTKLNLVYAVLGIMPPNFKEVASKRLEIYLEHSARTGSIRGHTFGTFY